jgi:hypothetical protein
MLWIRGKAKHSLSGTATCRAVPRSVLSGACHRAVAIGVPLEFSRGLVDAPADALDLLDRER